MKSNRILTIALALISTPFATFAQERALSNAGATAPTPPMLSGVHDSGEAAALADVLAVQPPAPEGPADLLKEYEEAMAMTAQGFNADVNQIAVAVHRRQISEDQGEYLAKEAYQLAMMQFQVLSGLHDMLEEQMSQAPAAPTADAAPAAGMNGSGYHNGIRTVKAGSRGI